MRWMRKSADNVHVDECMNLSNFMYTDRPYAREVGHVAEAVGVAIPAGVMAGHDIPLDAMTSVVHWLRKGAHDIVPN
jgi:hypothetical protein